MALWLFQFASAGTAVGAIVALAAAIVVYLLLQRSFKQTTEELRNGFERRIDSLENTIRDLASKAAQPAAPVQAKAAPVAAAPASARAPAPVVAAKTAEAQEIAPEMLLVLAAAVTAFLGKKVRIRSAKMVYSPESNNAWSQQGRVFVQASHNIAQRGY